MHTKNSSRQPLMAEHISRQNKTVVLNIIRQENEISRADIVKKSGLSAPTVTRIVDSLIQKEQLAVQVGIGESSRGRPPVIVRFNGENNYVIGIDWGRTHIHGIIANLSGETILNNDIPVDSKGVFGTDIDSITGLINMLIDNSNIDPSKILGIGLAVAGFVNKGSGNVEFSPNFGWSMVNIKEEIQREFDIPVLVDNVSRVMALGELCYGAGTDFHNFVFVNIGYGIGSGIIIDRKAYTGVDGFAGEIGHIRIKNNGTKREGLRKCVCGKIDCLECFASGRGISQTVRENIKNHPDSLINSICNQDPGKITTELIAQAAKAGDDYARIVFEDAATILAIAFANLANTLNPQAIIIGGKVTKAGDFFFKRIQKVFQQETLPHVSRPVTILRSKLVGEAAVKGAVALILKEVLELNVKT